MAPRNLSGERFSEPLYSPALEAQYQTSSARVKGKRCKLEERSKLARLSNVTRKVVWGENGQGSRQHTQRQGDAVNSLPKKPLDEEEEKPALRPRDEAQAH